MHGAKKRYRLGRRHTLSRHILGVLSMGNVNPFKRKSHFLHSFLHILFKYDKKIFIYIYIISIILYNNITTVSRGIKKQFSRNHYFRSALEITPVLCYNIIYSHFRARIIPLERRSKNENVYKISSFTALASQAVYLKQFPAKLEKMAGKDRAFNG
jgi:hypothetical protein